MNNNVLLIKKIDLVFALMAVFNFSVAQNFDGKTIYEATMLIGDESWFVRADESPFVGAKDIKMPERSKELEVKSGIDAVPINFELVFNGNESLYKSE